MGRLRFELKHPREARHAKFLLSRGHSDRQVAEMISLMNGLKINHRQVGRFRERMGKENVPHREPSKGPSPKLPQDWRRCAECGEQALIYDREFGEIVCSRCGVVRGPIRSHRIVDSGTQVTSYAPERPLGESHGLGSWVTYPDLTKIGAKHAARFAYNVKDSSPKEFRKMRNRASKILTEIPGLTSKTNEVAKARKAQISKAAAELLSVVFNQAKRELDSSQVFTDGVFKTDWRLFVPTILHLALSDYLPPNHRILTEFRKKYPPNMPLQAKIDKLLENWFNQPQPLTTENVAVLEAH